MAQQEKFYASVCAQVDDFDAALAYAVQQVTRLRIARPQVSIQPVQTPAALFAGSDDHCYHVTVSGQVPAPATVEVLP